jgi:ribosome-binding protein aMBF1 (putative translation factor)
MRWYNRINAMRRRRVSNALGRLRDQALEWPQDDFAEYYGRVGAEIAARRVERNLSQRELAELVDTTQSAIARVESGERAARIDTLLRIANALDCRLELSLAPRTRSRKGGGRATSH